MRRIALLVGALVAALAASAQAERFKRQWYSRRSDWSPMPYSVFFNGGFAVHGTYETRRLGQAASHVARARSLATQPRPQIRDCALTQPANGQFGPLKIG
jgi:hypothetical protein